MTMASNETTKFIRKPQVARRYGVTSRTVDRWTLSEGFPQPVEISGRRFWSESELAAFEQRNVKKRASGD